MIKRGGAEWKYICLLNFGISDIVVAGVIFNIFFPFGAFYKLLRSGDAWRDAQWMSSGILLQYSSNIVQLRCFFLSACLLFCIPRLSFVGLAVKGLVCQEQKNYPILIVMLILLSFYMKA